MEIYIIASGNSLRNFNFSLLKDKEKIGINEVYKYVDVQALAVWDLFFLKTITDYEGLIYGIHKEADIQWINHGDRLNRKDGYVGNMNCTVAMALNIAINKGYDKIYLLGADNKVGNYLHFYDKEKISEQKRKQYTEGFKLFDKFYRTISEDLKDEQIITVESNIKYFKNISMNEFVKITL